MAHRFPEVCRRLVRTFATTRLRRLSCIEWHVTTPAGPARNILLPSAQHRFHQNSPSAVSAALSAKPDDMSPPQPGRSPPAKRRYRPLASDHVENIEEYRPGGFHPVHLGDVLHDKQYRIVHKLGYGGFSTVWLARDEVCGRWVAVKIVAADYSGERCNELRIARYLARQPKVTEHPAHAYLPPLLDDFELDGPNGRHTCLVAPVAGPSITQLRFSPDRPYENRRLRGDLARKVAGQAAEAMAALHSTGVVHGGETRPRLLHPLNPLPCLPSPFRIVAA